jgi:hypothetical protein
VLVKTFGSIAPFAAGLAALGIAIWWLIGHDLSVGVWLLAAVLAGHGLVHAMFAMPQPPAKEADIATGKPEWPFDMGKSWLVTRAGLSLNQVRPAGLALVAVVALGFVLAAAATLGLVVPVGAWPVLVAVSALASGLLLALFFSPQLVLGLAIDALLLAVVLASIWSPATAN